MKTALWIALCLFAMLAAAEFVLIAAIYSRQDLDKRMEKVEFRLDHIPAIKIVERKAPDRRPKPLPRPTEER